MKSGRGHQALRTWLADPLLWCCAALALLVFGMPLLRPLFVAFFPGLDRPIYEQDTFFNLTVAHVSIVAISSGIAILIGVATGIFVTRANGREFRPLAETLVATGQTFPPVAVLAVATPLIGFGAEPAIIALALYGILPIAQNTMAGLDLLSSGIREAAEGVGLGPRARLFWVELPLAAPTILAGIRTSVVINIGTAAIASTVGVKSLGSPIIIGLSGFNTAYVLQGAMTVALLAICTDLAFGHLVAWFERWRPEAGV